MIVRLLTRDETALVLRLLEIRRACVELLWHLHLYGLRLHAKNEEEGVSEHDEDN